jgi:hypothetical protein
MMEQLKPAVKGPAVAEENASGEENMPADQSASIVALLRRWNSEGCSYIPPAEYDQSASIVALLRRWNSEGCSYIPPAE